MATTAFIPKFDVPGLSPTFPLAASIITFERLVLGGPECLAPQIDPVSLNFSNFPHEVKSLFRPHFVRNFRTVAARHSLFLKYCLILKTCCFIVLRSIFTNPKLSLVKWFFNTVANLYCTNGCKFKSCYNFETLLTRQLL